MIEKLKLTPEDTKEWLYPVFPEQEQRVADAQLRKALQGVVAWIRLVEDEPWRAYVDPSVDMIRMGRGHVDVLADKIESELKAAGIEVKQ